MKDYETDEIISSKFMRRGKKNNDDIGKEMKKKKMTQIHEMMKFNTSNKLERKNNIKQMVSNDHENERTILNKWFRMIMKNERTVQKATKSFARQINV